VAAAPVAVLVLYILAHLAWVVLLSLGLWVVAVISGRAALSRDPGPQPMPEYPASPPRRAFLTMNPRSGGGKVARFGPRGRRRGGRVAYPGRSGRRGAVAADPGALHRATQGAADQGAWQPSGRPVAHASNELDTEAADVMLTNGFRHLPVMEGRELKGMVSISATSWPLASALARTPE
jgi:hypothetical protein